MRGRKEEEEEEKSNGYTFLYLFWGQSSIGFKGFLKLQVALSLKQDYHLRGQHTFTGQHVLRSCLLGAEEEVRILPRQRF